MVEGRYWRFLEPNGLRARCDAVLAADAPATGPGVALADLFKRDHHLVAHFGGAHRSFVVSGDIAGTVAALQGQGDGLFHSAGLAFEAARVAKEQGGAQDSAERVCLILTGDVRGRAMDRLVQAEGRDTPAPDTPATSRAEARRGHHAKRRREDGGLVREDVAEKGLGDDDIELAWPLEQRQGEAAHGETLEVALGILGGQFEGPLAPEAGGLERVEFV